MPELFVKYCGFTRRRDVEAAVELGVDALGFIFYPKSKRYVTPERVREMTAAIPGSIKRIGIFVNEKADAVNWMARKAGLTDLQLFAHERMVHGGYDLPVMPVYRIGGKEDMASIGEEGTILLDAYSPTEAGGSGHSFDWSLLKEFALLDRTIVAGGIDLHNLKELLTAVSPYGIDVSSGIEEEKGIKSSEKMKGLMRIVNRYRSGSL